MESRLHATCFDGWIQRANALSMNSFVLSKQRVASVFCDGEIVRLRVANRDDVELNELYQTAFFLGIFRNRNPHRHIVERMFSSCESTMQRYDLASLRKRQRTRSSELSPHVDERFD